MAKRKSAKKASSTPLPKPKARKSSTHRKKASESPERSTFFGIDLDVNQEELNELTESIKPLFEGTPADRRRVSRDHIRRLTLDDSSKEITRGDRALFPLACRASESSLPGYATLDESHSADISTLIELIEDYVDDPSRRRPLNFLMLASPGAGKSHFISCIAKRMHKRKVEPTTFNMASMTANEELIRPLDDARNAKVEDRIPLLFLDEFDSSPSNFALLLPLLWDGSLSLGQRDLKLNKSIIVMAGSSPTLPEALNHAKSMRRAIPLPDGTNSKLIDLFSRINGSVVRIPPFRDTQSGIDRRSDKVAIAVNLLKRRFGSSLKQAPLALFRMIAKTNFRYDVRSIAHLIELIPYREDTTTIKLEDLGLPVDSPNAIRESSLAYHLVDDKDQAHGITEIWKWAKKVDMPVPVQLEMPFGIGEIAHLSEELLPYVVATVFKSLAD